jgi:SRSO17 transposase
MNPRELKRLERELTEYLDSMVVGMGRPERREAMSLYITGLLLDGARKSIEPLASRLVDDPGEIEAMRQRLQQCVSVSPWSDDELRRRFAVKMHHELPGIAAMVIDDTGFPKKGVHSVGVQRQYSGTLGRKDNCQVATSLHLAGEQASVCIATRLYLPESWTDDRRRCGKAGVPDEISFKTKLEIALELIDDAHRWGAVVKHVLADAGYGDAIEFRDGLAVRGHRYVVGVTGTAVVWAPGTGPIPPPSVREHRRGQPQRRYRTGDVKPVTMSQLAQSLGRSACKRVDWREGTKGRQSSHFGLVRVRTAHRNRQGEPPGEEQWLLYEWPLDEKEPTKFWLSNESPATKIKRLVWLAKLRWRVERDYQDLKEEVGLDHFEGRTWRGFHHHATLCAVAHGFLALRRALFPPEANEVDAADGAPPPATVAHRPHRHLPALQARGR